MRHILCLYIIFLMVLVNCGRQDPLSGFPQKVRNAVSPSQSLEKPPAHPLSEALMVIDVEPEVINFTEGIEGTFRISPRFLGVEVPHQIKIENLPAGASYDPQTGRVTWTPPESMVVGDHHHVVQYPLHIGLIAREEGELISVKKTVPLWIHESKEAPSIERITLNQDVIPENGRGELIVVVKEKSGSPQIDFIPTTNNKDENGIYYFDRKNITVVQHTEDENLWTITVPINLLNKDVTDQGYVNLKAGLVAYSRFGSSSRPYEVQYKVANRVQAPVSSWKSDALVVHGKTLNLDVIFSDPRREGQLSTDWEDTCKTHLKKNYKCHCSPSHNNSLLNCHLSWTPDRDAPSEVTFSHSVTNTNPHEGTDFQKVQFKNRLSVSGSPGINDVPVIEEVILGKNPIAENETGEITLMIRNNGGPPRLNFIPTSKTSDNGVPYLGLQTIQNSTDPDLWKAVVKIDFMEKDIVHGKDISLLADVVAYSRFGIPSKPYNLEYQVANRVQKPLSSWQSDILTAHGEPFHLTVNIKDPRQEGIIASDWEKSCEKYLVKNYTCQCLEGRGKGSLLCSLEWTPYRGVPKIIEFSYSATNSNRYHHEDIQKATFKNNIHISGHAGIKDSPVIERIELASDPLYENTEGELLVLVRNQTGPPSIDFVKSRGGQGGIDYLGPKSIRLSQSGRGANLWEAKVKIDLLNQNVTDQAHVDFQFEAIAHSRFGVSSPPYRFDYRVHNRVGPPETSWESDGFAVYDEMIRFSTVMSDPRGEGKVTTDWEKSCEKSFKRNYSCQCTASQRGNSLECFLEWTPDERSPESVDFVYSATNQSRYHKADAQTVQFRNKIHVKGLVNLKEQPVIEKAFLNSKEPIGEDEEGEITILVRDRTGSPNIALVPIVQGPNNGVHYLNFQNKKVVQSSHDKILWKITGDVHFLGQDITRQGYSDLLAGFVAYSRFGVVSKRYDLTYRVANRVRPPETSWPSEALAVYGRPLHLNVKLTDPRGEGKITSSWEKSCEIHLKQDYNCGCEEAEKGSVQHCFLEWTPDTQAPKKIDFVYSVVNKNPHNDKDFQEKIFKNTIYVEGHVGIREVPVVQSVTLTPDPLPENKTANLVVEVRDRSGRPSLNFVEPATGGNLSVIDYLSLKNLLLTPSEENPDLWHGKVKIDFLGQDITGKKHINLKGALVANSRFGLSSQPYDFQVQVLNKILSPVTSWKSEEFAIYGKELHFPVILEDPRGEGKITTNWKSACQQFLKQDYSCECRPLKNQSSLKCFLTWTPDLNTPKAIDFIYTVTNTNLHDQNDIRTKQFKNTIRVEGIADLGEIPIVERVALKKGSLAENEKGALTISVRYKGKEAPTINLVPSTQKQIKNGLHYLTRRNLSLIQTQKDSTLWRGSVDVDFFGQNVVGSDSIDLHAGVVAYSPFGMASSPYEFAYRVDNRVIPPESSWKGNAFSMRGEEVQIEARLVDPRGEGKISSDWEKSCQQHLKKDYSCQCHPDQNGTVLNCKLKWLPPGNVADTVTFRYSATNTNRYQKHDSQTVQFTKTFNFQGFAGVNDAPILEEIVFNKNPIHETENAIMTVVIRDKSGGPPTMNIYPKEIGAQDITPYLFRKSKLVQDPRDPTLWRAKVDVNFMKRNIVKGAFSSHLNGQIAAYSRFGIPADLHSFKVEVLNKMMPPTTPRYGKINSAIHDTLFFRTYINDPFLEGKLSVNWREACRQYLRSRYKCSCKSFKGGSALDCQMEWTPTRRGQYPFIIEAKNTNPYNPNDVETKTFEYAISIGKQK